MMRELGLFAVGLVFLFLAKAKNSLRGYMSPKPYGVQDPERCLDYDMRVVSRWLTCVSEYRGVEARVLVSGKDVLELGPGSDLGVGLYLLFSGVGTYAAVDVNGLALTVPDTFYDSLFAHMEAESEANSIGDIRGELTKLRSGGCSRLRYVVRDDFDLVAAFGERAFDFVFSQAAFEHFDDVEATIRQLTVVSRPGAVMVAGIDLKTHSRWIRDRDPNNIYRYPQWLYRLFWFRGAPNRVRPVQYVRALERSGWTDISVTPVDRVEGPDLHSYAAPFRDASNEMHVLSAILRARKPDMT